MKKESILSRITIAFIIATSMAILQTNGKAQKSIFDSDEILSQKTRANIYNLIRNNEGIHFREICRQLNKKMGVIQYHISVLEKHNYIKSVKNGRYKCFFVIKNDIMEYEPTKYLSNPQKQIRQNLIVAIKCKTPQTIINYLHENKEASHKTLAQICSISPQAITFHCQRLEKMDIISSKRVGREKFYYLNEEVIEIFKYI
ncbi:MAG: winged helix-turn-helix transcriptional regulator [Promethearchaeota archaeon]